VDGTPAVPRKPTSTTRHAAAGRRSYQKHKAKRRADQNAKNDRNRARQARPIRAELAAEILTAGQLQSPFLYWLSPSGQLRIEEELSAEELIRRWEKAQGEKK
jgi:hypothetical protein